MASTRRLAAILAADIAGYSRLMGADEVGTVQALREHRSAADPLIAQQGGRVVKTTGDGLLIEFGSVVGAVECALGLQGLAEERNAGTPSERRMDWRIGVHLGDVLIEGEDILGEGVNIAARLEGIAEPGGICISDDVFRQVRGKVEAEFADLGEQSLKNIARPLRVYRVGSSPASNEPIAPTAALPLPDKPSIAVMPFQNLSGDPEQEYFADGMVEEIIFSNRHFSGVLDLSPLPGVQRFTRLILAHRHPRFSRVFWARLHRNYARPRAPRRLPRHWSSDFPSCP
jgi:adenylate cyclase